VTLVAFEWFRQINISPNPLLQQITKYYIRQYFFLYSNYKHILYNKTDHFLDKRQVRIKQNSSICLIIYQRLSHEVHE